MGMLRDVKVNTAATHAQRAEEQRHTTFLYRQNIPHTAPGLSGPIGDFAEVIEAIEASRYWRLVDTMFDGQQSKNGAVILLFRSTR